MPTLLEVQADSILRSACEAPSYSIGIIVHVTDNTSALRLKQVLYRFRKELNDAEYKSLQILLSPIDPDKEVWIIRKEHMPTDPEPSPADEDKPQEIQITF